MRFSPRTASLTAILSISLLALFMMLHVSSHGSRSRLVERSDAMLNITGRDHISRSIAAFRMPLLMPCIEAG